MSGDDIVGEARTWIGTPWIHQAALKGIGCDCIGLVSGVADALGIPEARAWRADVRFKGYGEIPVPERLLEACDIYLEQVPLPEATIGSVLVFSVKRQPMHFGIMSGPAGLIHGWRPIGRVIEQPIDTVWRRRLFRAYRYRSH